MCFKWEVTSIQNLWRVFLSRLIFLSILSCRSFPHTIVEANVTNDMTLTIIVRLSNPNCQFSCWWCQLSLHTYLIFWGTRRQQNFLCIEELGQRLCDWSSALIGDLMYEWKGFISRLLFLGNTVFTAIIKNKKRATSSKPEWAAITGKFRKAYNHNDWIMWGLQNKISNSIYWKTVINKIHDHTYIIFSQYKWQLKLHFEMYFSLIEGYIYLLIGELWHHATECMPLSFYYTGTFSCAIVGVKQP